VPLWSGEAIVGVLNVETTRDDGFSEAQRAGLAAFGRWEGERFARALLRHNERAQGTLLAEALARADTSFGQLLQIEGDELVIVQTTGGEPVGTRVTVADSVSGQAVLAASAYYVPDVDQEPRYRRYLGEEMKSELAVPLLGGERVIGVLNVESPVPAFFTIEHARILQALAGQAAVAIERAQRTEVERLAAIGGLAGDIIHRLNNPLGALGGWLDMLRRKPFYGELVTAYPYVDQFVARAERDIDHAKAIIQELRTELRRQAPGAISLQAAIMEALKRCGLVIGDNAGLHVSVTLPPDPVRVVAGPSLTGVFWNVFDNAVKASAGGGTLSVVARGQDAGWVTVEIADTGVGIEPWRLPHIFEAGASTTADRYAPAHGLGLWWAHSQVESFGGTIEVVSAPEAGTRFTLRLRTAV
jgi:signal transduction histidine kinase